jgi:hypothetical protein
VVPKFWDSLVFYFIFLLPDNPYWIGNCFDTFIAYIIMELIFCSAFLIFFTHYRYTEHFHFRPKFRDLIVCIRVSVKHPVTAIQ